jgi:ribosomal protein S3
LSGAHLVIKGKIGALGCVRKKVIHIRRGAYSLSKYKLKGDCLYSYAHTQTGKIGVKLIICYR